MRRLPLRPKVRDALRLANLAIYQHGMRDDRDLVVDDDVFARLMARRRPGESIDHAILRVCEEAVINNPEAMARIAEARSDLAERLVRGRGALATFTAPVRWPLVALFVKRCMDCGEPSGFCEVPGSTGLCLRHFVARMIAHCITCGALMPLTSPEAITANTECDRCLFGERHAE